MAELAELTRTAGGQVVESEIQRRAGVDPRFFIGRGKVDELRSIKADDGYDIVICNDDLSARQQRNLENELKARVVDRTELILDIFGRHARTREGRLQVESARLHHVLPRLIGAYAYDRQTGGLRGGQRGGVGARGGAGEQQIEVERRRIRRRMRDLDKELKEVGAQREQQRAGRRRSDLETVAIVGYTNSGKSTLLNALTGAAVGSEDRLFATLDPTTRRLGLPSGRELLLTDTVGFIQKLPTDLVAAFRATLEEVTHAGVVLHLLDVSSAAFADHAETVEQVLGELGAAETSRVVALNKVDVLGPAARRRAVQAARRLHPGAVAISATEKTGFDELLEALDRASRGDSVDVELLVPYGSESVLSELRQVGGLQRSEYGPRGTRASGWAPRHALHRFRDFLVHAPDQR